MPETPKPRQAKRGSTRQRIGAGVAVVTASAVAVGVVLGAGPSSSQGAGKPGKSSGAATVARRDLVSTDTESGTLGYANAQTVFNRLTGTITSLPAVGKVISPGQPLYRVDGAPVVLFDGGTPAFRDLAAGVGNGLDIRELKSNLKTLGFDPDHQITVNQTFDAATAAAVERWQASLGQTQTGTVTLGQIVFLPGPQRITKVDTVLGSTGSAPSASTGTSSTSSASTVVAAPRAEFISLTPDATTSSTTSPGRGSGKPSTCPTTTGSGSATQTPAMRATEAKIAALCSGGPGSTSITSKQTLAALIALLKAETLLLQRSGSSTGKTGGTPSSSSGLSGGSRGSGGGTAGTGATSGSGSSGGGGSTRAGSASGGSASGGSASAGSGSGGGSAQAILQTTSTQPVVTVDLDATKQSEAVVGQPVSVELPSGGTVEGKITGVSPVAQSASSSTSSSSSGGGGGGGSSSSSTPSATVPVTIALKGHRAESGLDQAAVSVNFEQQVENNVLSVPVTALLATSGGGYAVQEASAGHRLIPVTPGLFAAGFVQVSGAGIYPGLQITDSQG